MTKNKTGGHLSKPKQQQNPLQNTEFTQAGICLRTRDKKKGKRKKTNQMIQILLKPLPPVKQMTEDLKSKF